jgi:tripartite-type tricarboxylate transporter receptor subunit TctC
MTFISYKGSAPAIQDLIGGQVPVSFETVTVAAPHIKSGKARALAVTSAKRTRVLPDTPTMQEAGVPNFDVASWQALYAPAGTPPAIVSRMNAEVEKILATPEVAVKLDNLGLEHAPNTPAQFAEFNRAELVKWAKIVKDRKITPQP